VVVPGPQAPEITGPTTGSTTSAGGTALQPKPSFGDKLLDEFDRKRVVCDHLKRDRVAAIRL
jgi:hypothetical protein